MKRYIASLLSLFVVVAVTVSAQAPAGWKLRVDKSTSASDPDGTGNIKFSTVSGGFHAVAPQAAVFWNPANTATGTYTIKGTFTLNEPANHTSYYGLVFGGRDLEGPNQRYIYFLVAQDGTFLVKAREGDASSPNVQARTPHAAVRKPEAGGKSTNDLEVRVTADKIDYVVNGTVVHSTPKTGLTANTDGIYGFRVNHFLNVQVTGLSKS